MMSHWFGNIDLIFSLPIPVQIANASGGATTNLQPGFLFFSQPSATITKNPGNNKSLTIIRYLLVSEVTELFMASQKRGWFYPGGLFSLGDEGSKGEGLSRFLAVQFLLENGLGSAPPATFAATQNWLNGSRQDFVNNNPDDKNDDETNGCTTLFLYYLHDYLHKGIDDIVAAGSSNLAGVYQNLTGRTDGWDSFITIVNRYYPPSFGNIPFNYSPYGQLVQPH